MHSTQEGSGSPSQNSGTRVTTLARDLADFLVEFSIVLHKRAMYPVGHPHLEEATGRFVNRLESLLVARGSLALGVAWHQLIVAGVATDPRNALLSDLARRLHRHRIATVRLDRGITHQEMDELVGVLASDPQGETGPAGLRAGLGASWSHLRLQPPELNRLFLQDEDDPTDVDTAGDALWLGLAQLALSADDSGADDAADPLVVARAIDAQRDQTAYDRVVLDYLGQMTAELSNREEPWAPVLRQRVSQLVSSLEPETLRRVFRAGAGPAERRRLARTAAEVLTIEAVLEVLEAAAATTGQTISHQLIRLLHKLARHAEQAPGEQRTATESALREQVTRLVNDWRLEDPNPDSYSAVLDGMVGQSYDRLAAADEGLGCDPDTVLQLALETDCAGPRAIVAMEALVAARRLPEATRLLRAAPQAARATADALWRHVATPARLHEELAAPAPDFAVIEDLIRHLGSLATEPLLNLLEQSADRSVRAHTLRLLASLGPPVAAAAAARLEAAPWYLQRNLLMLLRTLQVWPPGFSALPYARHPDPRLRREALKLMLEFPAHRTSAILRGLRDPHPEINTLALRGAADGCPPEAREALERFADDGRRALELRALAIRALDGASEPQALARLMELAGAKRHVLLGWRLGTKSPVVVAALAALVRHWHNDAQAAGLLKAARRHRDPEIRLAAAALEA